MRPLSLGASLLLSIASPVVEAFVGICLPGEVDPDAEVDQCIALQRVDEPNAICGSASASTAMMTRQRRRSSS